MAEPTDVPGEQEVPGAVQPSTVEEGQLQPAAVDVPTEATLPTSVDAGGGARRAWGWTLVLTGAALLLIGLTRAIRARRGLAVA